MRCLLLSLCACGLFVAGCNGDEDDQEPAKPIEITLGVALSEPAAPTHAAIEPSVSYDGTRVHLVYCQSDAGGSHNLMYTQRLGGGPFSAPAPLFAASTGDSRRPHAVLDGAGNLHVVWVEGTAPNREIHYATRSATGVISAAANLTNSPTQDENNPRVHVDATGRVHVVWEGATLPPNPTSAVFYRRTVGSVFAAAQILPFAQGGITGEMPDVGTDAQQHVYAVWAESNGAVRNIRMMRSDDNGATFNNVGDGTAIGGSADKTEPRIVCGVLGEVILAFVAQNSAGERAVYASYTRTGGTFADPGQLFKTTTGGVRGPSLATYKLTDGPRVVMLAFNDGGVGGGNILVKTSRDGGETWAETPVDVSIGNSQPATNRMPSIALDDNELIATWVAQPTGGGIARTFTSSNTYGLPD